MTPPARRGGAVALLVALLLALAAPAGAGTVVDPDAAAVPADPAATVPATPAPPGAVSTEPVRGGLTPEGVATAPVPGPRAEPPSLSATGAVLIDPVDGVLLAGIDPRTPRRMASTTKIMTVLLAMEAVEEGRVDPTLTVSAAAAATGQLPGVATLGLQAGDEVAVRDVLAAELLRSGNDGAVALAEHVAGSEAAYVELMNRRAETLGLEDTAFLDSSGLSDDPAHHATPLDLALLGYEAMGHEEFAAWAGARALDVEPFGVLENRNELIGRYDGTTGVKTGFTTLAGQCLVASVERDGRVLYAVVLGSEDRVADTTALFDHGLTAYARPTPIAAGQVAATYRTSAGEVALTAPEELARTVGAGADVQLQVALAPDAGLPIEAGAPLGEAVLLVDGEPVDTVDLRADAALAGPGGGAADGPGGAVADALRAFARLAPRTAAVDAGASL